MLRKLGFGFTALAMMTPAMAVALGVGEYELNSYLNQPLEMEVSLHEVGDLSAEEILVNLAPQSEFDSAGVERSYFLNRLEFSVELTGGDEAVLYVTTDQPVREPYLNFLVEFLWPTGRLMREYTVLLDPPSFSDSATSSVPTITRAPAPVTSTAPVTSPEPAPAPAPAPAPTPAATASDDYSAPATTTSTASSGPRDTYTVKASDTMWRVALNTRPADSVSVQQMLVAIQDLNPDAFIDNNVNLVREGTVLRIPNEQEVRSVSTRNALVEVADQNRKWRDMLEARGIQLAPQQRAQLDGSREVATSDDDNQASPTGQVKLVTPESTDSVADGDSTGSSQQGSANTAVLENELAIRDENLDRLDRENAELKSRLEDLESQNETSEQLLQLRNDQITQLQEELRKLREAQGVEAAANDPLTAPVDDMAGDEPVADEADSELAMDGADEPMDATAESADDAANNEQASDAIAGTESSEQPGAEDAVDGSETSAGDAAVTDNAQADDAVTVTEAAPEVVKPEPAPAQPATQPQAGIVELLMENLLYIALGALAILLLVFLVLRRKKDDDEPAEETALFDEFEDESQDDFGLHLDDDMGESAADLDEEAGDDGHAPQDSNLDPMEDVEVYVAYGRYPQAVDFLRNEINKHPERDDLKVRLLELLKETNDDAGFEQQVTAFAGVSATVDQAIARLGGDVPAGAGNDGDELSLDDLEMGLSSEMDESSIPTMEADEPEPASRSNVADELGDFDFDLDGADELSGDETLILDEDSDAEGGDLSLDLNDTESADDALSDADRKSLEASSVVNLDDVSSATLDEGDADYGDLDLSDMSAEFTDAGGDSAASSEDDLDLSLDDLDLDGENDTADTSASSDDNTLNDLDFELDEAEKSLESSSSTDSLEDITAFDLDAEEDKKETVADEASLEDLVSDDDLDLDTDFDTDFSTGDSVGGTDDTLDLDSLMEDDSASDADVTLELEGLSASEPAPAPQSEAASAAAPAGDDLLGDEDDFDFLGETDENATKLDLAKAYIDMGDSEGAKDILNEVISEGNDQQQAEARELMGQVG